jgi:uncharacterized protein (TIGR00661 family)
MKTEYLCAMPGKQKRILVAALDWGLGHATRSVQLIRKYQSEGTEVILASAGSAFNFYKYYFPELRVIQKPAYRIKYFGGIPFSLSIFLQIPKILWAIKRENRWLKKIISEEKITSVVSDNCYGLYNSSVHTTFITHQLRIICPPSVKIFESFIRKKIISFINRFNECLVPDFADADNLSGTLSHLTEIRLNVKYIGPLSRFNQYKHTGKIENYDVVIILSGPEPQRSLFEKSCRKIFSGKNLSVCILKGKPENNSEHIDGNITTFNHVDDDKFASILKGAKKIICRSGYSTIMDLHALNLTALLIPTPGQTEQEYLASYHAAEGKFETTTQEGLRVMDDKFWFTVCSERSQTMDSI